MCCVSLPAANSYFLISLSVLYSVKIERRINFYEKETKTSFHGEEMDCSARRCCSDSCSNLLLYLRAAKNRYGSTNEIGVFEMSDHGLLEVQNPSAAMLAGHPQGASGNCIACVMEGSRPLLAEVQALAAKTQFGVPRRTAAGVDYNRMVLLLAILEKRCGLFLSSSDVYVNVVGGMRLDEPAAPAHHNGASVS